MASRVRRSYLQDVFKLAPHLRDADMVELEAQGLSPELALLDGFIRSDPGLSVLRDDGEPCAMFGVAPIDTQMGSIWLLGTDDLLDIRWEFARQSKYWLERISQKYNLTCNVVHQDNKVHIRWLKFLGFTFLRRTPPFIEFCKIHNV